MLTTQSEIFYMTMARMATMARCDDFEDATMAMAKMATMAKMGRGRRWQQGRTIARGCDDSKMGQCRRGNDDATITMMIATRGLRRLQGLEEN